MYVLCGKTAQWWSTLCVVETVVNLCLLGLVLYPMMYSALDHFMESRAI